MMPAHRFLGRLGLVLGLSAALIAPRAAHATAYSFGVTYFTIAGTYHGAGSGDPDFNTIGCCNGTFSDEVLSSLGPHGLPVYNTSYGDHVAHPLHDVNSDGELTWWSPSMNSYVTQTGSGTVTSPFTKTPFYPPNGTGSDDAHGFQGAIISGVFTLPAAQQVTFTLGADDDAFLYVDGTVVTQMGGIHGIVSAPANTSTLTAGNHTFKLFYVDRNESGAGLNFSLDTAGLIVNPVPEPASVSLLAVGLLGLGLTRRRVRPMARG